MEKTVTLEEALKRIEELEEENAELREELEYYRNRKLSGRQKHNAKWMAIYNDFVVGYESGMTMVEIAKRNNVSERTIYRYKAYYDKMKIEMKENDEVKYRTIITNRILLTSAICSYESCGRFF
ncbi:MAG: helix-turn-helix domain-containing protein [Dorea sp.]